jgi:hypothetical protein
MASTTCGRCGRLAYMPAVSGLHMIWDPMRRGAQHEAVYKCPNCKRLNLASEWNGQDNYGAHNVYPEARADEEEWYSPEWLPRRGEVQDFENVPPHIAQAASEATLCLSVGAYRAVGALARAVVEATAKDKKATGTNLETRIDALHAADHIRTHTQEQAHEVRHFGNDMAHGDFADAVTKEEAEEVVELMAEVLDEVYQSPARLEARKTARLAKKAGVEEG